MDPSDLTKLATKFPLSASTIARNSDPVAGLGGKVGESGPNPALVRNRKRQPRRKGRLAVCVTIVSCRQRIADDDNSLAGGNKALRDAIAQSLTIDDGSPIVRWQYAQVHTCGREGTLVVIEKLT